MEFLPDILIYIQTVKKFLEKIITHKDTMVIINYIKDTFRKKIRENSSLLKTFP